MEGQQPRREMRRVKASAHVCPQCGFSINLRDLGLRGGATGLVTCPQCDWSGPVEVQIIDKDLINGTLFGDGISPNERCVQTSADPRQSVSSLDAWQTLQMKVKTGVSALGEIPSVPEKGSLV
jgi:predicted RNA-binding Zn-ribbon protein involved in translation (DUF1610 family)